MSSVFAFSILSRAVLLVLAAALPVRVTMNSGETLESELVEISDSSVVVQIGSEKTELAFDDVLSLVPTNVAEATGPTSRVTLVDGTKVAVQDFSLAGETLAIEPRRQDVLNVPVKLVKSVRFRVASPVTDPQWLGLLDKPQRRDLLVIRREGDRLDPTEGIVESISDDKVSFNLDGETVDAPTQRLEGVVFGGGASDPDTSAIQIVDRYGSRWLATSIELPKDSKSLRMQIGDSLSHALPLAHIESVRWSGGLTLLATQSPADSSYTPYLKTDVDDKLMKDWFGPASSGESDLSMVGDSYIEYRLEQGFQTIAGAVHRDENVTRAGDAVVSISLDGESVWREKLSGAETLGFELPCEDAKRLRIQLDTADDGDIGDRVIIVRPRMLK